MNYLLIGRPNVGKSSIFNYFTIHNANIVHSEAGTTRDWHKELIKDTNSYIYDSPGVLVNENNDNNNLVFDYFADKNFINQINTFIYVLDYKSGYNEVDQFSINKIRKFNKDIILLVNKFDNFKKTPNHEFHKYGLKKIFFISCAHSYGFENLNFYIKSINSNQKNLKTHDYSIAIFGKPNAGKSTFLNSLVGYNRAKISPIANTTSDFVIDYVNFKNKTIKVVDTAGIGKKSNIKNKSINFLSIKKTFENLHVVDSSIVIIDSSEGIDRQDKRIIKLVSEKSKSVILIFNKVDLIEDKLTFKSEIVKDLQYELSEVKNIKIFFISAKIKNNVSKILDYLFNFYFVTNNLISTSKLNLWLKKIVKKYPHPLISNKTVNFKYIVQIKEKPVTIKIFCSYPNKLKQNYKKYLINNFNLDFKILNQKTKFIFSSSKNPYV